MQTARVGVNSAIAVAEKASCRLRLLKCQELAVRRRITRVTPSMCQRLIAHQDEVLVGMRNGALTSDYAASWRRNFARGVHTAAVCAHPAMRPAAARVATAVLKRALALLTLGAYWSGKAQSLSAMQPSDPA